MTMTAADRARLRRLQDRWLALACIRRQIERYGEDEPIQMGYPGQPWPTFRQVRDLLHPDLESWFADYFREES